MDYYIGIDGHSTYSRVVALSSEEKVLGRHMGNGVHLQNHREKVKENLERLIIELNKMTSTRLKECKGLCASIAGVDTDEDKEELENIFKQMGVTCKIKIVSEQELILATHIRGEAGVAVFAGTGCYAYAKDAQGNTYRCGGYGYLIDDAGSGYSIGMQAIRYAFMSYDGRLPKTALEEKVRAHFSVEAIPDICDIIYSEQFNRAKIADLVMAVKQAAEAGDQPATIIEQSSARELSLLARSLIIRGKLQKGKVVLSGNVLLMNDRIQKTFIQLLKKDFPEIEVAATSEKPEMGAAFLAMNE